MFDALIVLEGDLPTAHFWKHYAFRSVICTDGAAHAMADLSIQPDLIIGDMDSIVDYRASDNEKEIQDLFPSSQIVALYDQNTTDFEKALNFLNAKGIKKVLCLGLFGKSADHALYNLMLINLFSDRLQIYGLHVFEDQKQWILPLRSHTHIKTTSDTVFSLLSLTDATISTHGLKWDLVDTKINTRAGNSVRNRTISGDVQIHCEGACLCFILSAEIPELKNL